MEKEGFAALLRRGIYMMAAVVAACTMVACSSDDDGGGNPPVDPPDLSTPAMEASAAKYEITGDDSPLRSLELTASGNYIIYLNETESQPEEQPGTGLQAAAKRVGFAAEPARAAGTRATLYSNILYGKYTKTGDNEYALEGYGTLTVTQQDGSAVSLHIERTGGQEFDLSGNRAGNTSTGANTDLLCRTWNYVGVRAYIRVGGQTYFDYTAKTNEELLNKLVEYINSIGGDLSADDLGFGVLDVPTPRQFVFTKSGTYMVFYNTDYFAVSTWRWADQGAGLMEYSWNPDTFDDSYVSGRVTTKFSGKRLEITEGASDPEDEASVEYAVVHIMEEA